MAGRSGIRILIIASLAMCVMGSSCNSDAASVFRHTATSSIGEGIRVILYGLVDGVVAAVESVGDRESQSK